MAGHWVRRVALLTACTAGVLGWGVTRSKAALQEGARDAGEVFFGLAGTLGEGHHRVWLNGLAFDVRSRVLDVEGEALLDALEARCKARDAGLGKLLGRRLGRTQEVSTAFRLASAGAGMIACLDLGEASWTPQAWQQRLDRLATAGDFASLGQVRLARVQPVQGKTHLVTVASRGEMILEDAFPADRDAPGVEIEGLPRPPGSRRILSAHAEQHAPALLVYEAQGTALDVDAWLHAWRAEGFAVVARKEGEEVCAWVATRGATRAVLSLDLREARPVASISVLSR